jgi:hypothetical protein
MQNIKPIEDYKKQIRSQKEQDPELDPETDSLDEPALDGEDDEMDATDATAEVPSEEPAFSAPVTNQISTDDSSERPYMVITNLKKIADQANQLVSMISSNGKVEPWAVDHITTSADDVEEVYNYYKYKD